MTKSLTRRNAIIAGTAASAIVATAPQAIAEDIPHITPVDLAAGETEIIDKPLYKAKTTAAEIEGLNVPKTVDSNETKTVLQGLEGKKVEEYATMIAVSWEGEQPDSIEARAQNLNGTWSEWFKLDPIGDNETSATEAAWIGESAATEIRASLYGEDVSEVLTAHVIQTAADDNATATPQLRTFSLFSTSALSTYQPGYKAPNVISRSAWGAKESQSRSTSSSASTKGVFVHHTAGSNNYSKSQSAQQLRGMYDYHTKTLGWADLGYNAVVDQYGQIFEGRKGGLAKNITGAHSLGFNRESFGISVMGTYSSKALPAAAQEAVAKIIAWKLGGTFNMSATAKTTFYNTTSGTKHPKNSNVRLNIIAGHRDVNYTDCPGTALYNRLGTIRSRVQTLINSSYKGHYNAYVAAGSAAKLGTVTEIAQVSGKYEVTRLSKGLVISEKGAKAKGYITSFSNEWASSWGRPLVSVYSDVQTFENGSARRSKGKVTFTQGSGYFVDVPDTRAFAADINLMASKGITRGWLMKDGTRQYRPTGPVNRDILITFLYRAMGSPKFTAPKKSPFLDVKTNHAFYKEISWAKSVGIAKGFKAKGGRKFAPSAPVRRDEMAAFLRRASGDKAPKASNSAFADVKSTHSFAADITWMKKTGISKGYKNGSKLRTYRSANLTRRDEMAAFLIRWMKYTKRL